MTAYCRLDLALFRWHRCAPASAVALRRPWSLLGPPPGCERQRRSWRNGGHSDGGTPQAPAPEASTRTPWSPAASPAVTLHRAARRPDSMASWTGDLPSGRPRPAPARRHGRRPTLWSARTPTACRAMATPWTPPVRQRGRRCRASAASAAPPCEPTSAASGPCGSPDDSSDCALSRARVCGSAGDGPASIPVPRASGASAKWCERSEHTHQTPARGACHRPATHGGLLAAPKAARS
jgi:hypothetical protein